MVMMFPQSGHSPAEFSFKGPNVLTESSGDDVRSFRISHSTISNQSLASVYVSLDTQGFAELLSPIFTCVSYAEARNRYRLDVRLSVRHTLVLYQNG